MRLPRIFDFMIKYVAPAYLLTMIGLWAYNDLPKQWTVVTTQNVPFLTMCVIGGVLVFLLILINIAGRRWKVEQIDTAAGPGGQPRVIVGGASQEATR